MTTDRLRALAVRVDRSMPSIAGRAARRVVRSPRLRRLRRLRSRPRWGNLRRLRPFSDHYGWERGTPIDRRYLHDFFARHAADIKGHVLEIGWPEFSGPHGSNVARVDVLDIDPGNDEATIVGDLSEVGSLPAGTFDCAVVPQTFQFVPDLERAVDNLWQSLKPGGVLLVTMPSLSQLDPAHIEMERWRMLPEGMRYLLEARCPGADIDVRGYGNLLAAIGFLLGLVAEELDDREIDEVDPYFLMLTCARARKPDRGP